MTGDDAPRQVIACPGADVCRAPVRLWRQLLGKVPSTGKKARLLKSNKTDEDLLRAWDASRQSPVVMPRANREVGTNCAGVAKARSAVHAPPACEFSRPPRPAGHLATTLITP